MKIMCLFLFIMTSCYPRAFEMEEMSKDVLRSHEGIEIDVKPIDRVKNKDDKMIRNKYYHHIVK